MRANTRERRTVWAVLGWLLLAGGTAMAAVQVLPEAAISVDGRPVKGQLQQVRHPAVKGILAAFDQAESSLQREDLEGLMTFYAPAYNYHGLKESDVRRVWGEVFEHYKGLTSTHLFSEIKIFTNNSQLRAEVTCTGGLYGTEEQTGKRITLDSWFREVHFLEKVNGLWRFLGNAGEAPTATPFSSAPHHPLF